MSRAVVIALLPLLAGCHVQTKNPAEAGRNISVNASEGGQVSFNFPFAKGNVTIPGMVMNGGHMDIDGVRMMPGSRVTGFNIDARNDGSTIHMNFTAPASADAARAYFADQFRKTGGQVAVAGDAVTGTSKDGSPLVIHIAAAPQGSRGTIDIQSKD